MLLRTCGKAAGVYFDSIPADLSTHLHDDACLVVKSHTPDPNVVAIARLLQAPLLISVRDPRDCLVSMETAFEIPRLQAIAQLKMSASTLLSLSDYPNRLLIKYEDAVDRSATLRSLASHLGVVATDDLIERIARELSLETIKNNIADWETQGVLDKSRAVEVWTEESHWHANHCGDGSIGKYKEHLSPTDSAVVASGMRTFLEAFGYVSDEPPVVESGRLLQFNEDAMIYALEGLSWPEEWGAWTDAPCARIALPLANFVHRVRLEISLVLPITLNGATNEIFLNGRRIAELPASPHPGELLLLYEGDLDDHRADLEFRFQNLASPQSLGVNADERLIGVGLKTLKVRY